MRGLPVSPGYAAAPALLYRPATFTVEPRPIDPSRTADELARFHSAVQVAEEQIDALQVRAGALLSEEEAKVFAAHKLVLRDSALHKKVTAQVEACMCAPYAVEQAMKEITAMLESMDNPLLRERAADIRDVCGRVIRILLDIKTVNISQLEEDCILVAADLTPSDTIQMDLTHIKGIITELGGKTSHTAILARSLELPAVVGVSDALAQIPDGALLLLDAVSGEIMIEPDGDTRSAFSEKQTSYLAERQEIERYAALPSFTADGRHIEIAANIGSLKEAEAALRYGPDGVGLFRTEFLFMGKTAMPSEEEQFLEYRRVGLTMGEKPIVFRTLDIGGDKALPYIDFGEEENPFLGWRAIRMCLDREDLFLTQLRALLRASVFGRFRIMYPMVINVEEVRRANALLEQAKQELRKAGISFDENIQVGIMIETPAAAMTADLLAPEVDFFSIGTNDLTQYTLAVDRGNERIAHLYQSCHPAILRLVHQICEKAHRNQLWVGMCGELAGDERMTALLLGLGLDELSMSGSSVTRVRRAASMTELPQAYTLALEAMNCSTTEEVLRLIDDDNKKKEAAYESARSH